MSENTSDRLLDGCVHYGIFGVPESVLGEVVRP
jgi:hypothetical protein